MKVLCFWFINRFKAQSLFLRWFVKLRDAPVRELYGVLKDRLLKEIQKNQKLLWRIQNGCILLCLVCAPLVCSKGSPIPLLINLRMACTFSTSFMVSECSESLQVLWLRQSESDLSTPLIGRATGKVITSNRALFISSLEISAFLCKKNNPESLQVPSLCFNSLYLHCQYSLNNINVLDHKQQASSIKIYILVYILVITMLCRRAAVRQVQ